MAQEIDRGQRAADDRAEAGGEGQEMPERQTAEALRHR